MNTPILLSHQPFPARRPRRPWSRFLSVQTAARCVRQFTVLTRAAMMLALLCPAAIHATLAGAGAATAGGSRSTAGLYASVATLGQFSGASVGGGVYRLTGGSFLGSLPERPPELVLGDVTALATGALELSTTAAGLRAAGFRDPNLDTLWLRADGYTADSPIYTLRLSLAPLTPQGDGWSLLIASEGCCRGVTGECPSGLNCPPPRPAPSVPGAGPSGLPTTNAVTLSLMGQADGSLLLRNGSLPEVDDEVLVAFFNADTYAGSQSTRASQGVRMQGAGRLTGVEVQPDAFMLTFDQPMQLLPAGSAVSADRVRWRVLRSGNQPDSLGWVGLSGGNLAGGALVLRNALSRSPAPPRMVSAIFREDGRFHLRVAGEPGAVLSLESSLSLGVDAAWRPDGTLAIGRGTEVELESDSARVPAGFYRVRAD